MPTKAEQYESACRSRQLPPPFEVPKHARSVVAIVVFDDDSIHVGSPTARGLDEDHIIDTLGAAVSMYSDQLSAETTGFHTPLGDSMGEG